MRFLEASRLAAADAGLEPLPFRLLMSGTPDPLMVYLRAVAARAGRRAEPATIAFNTLQQFLLAEAGPMREVALLLPWDLVPLADWRSGVPVGVVAGEVLAQAEAVAARIRRRADLACVYLPAPLPPMFGDPADAGMVEAGLLAIAHGLGARVLDAGLFSLASYLASGCPVDGGGLAVVAEALVDKALGRAPASAKVLVTDLDQVMWSGIVGEDGPEGVAMDPEGPGFRHFIYQTFLARLKADGILLAAVSRNHPDDALAPFRLGRTRLGLDDFVALVASYEAKSAQIAQLAERLNLGLDAFVFVDDNPIELAEVGGTLPAVTAVAFPASEIEMPAFLARVNACFPRRGVTDEDRQRTELYRRRFEGMAPSGAQGADLHDFLAGLGMRLAIADRGGGDRTRAIQLINKTNQFNLNGARLSDAEVEAVLAAGGRLWTATLSDRTGSHGEILAALVSADGEMVSLVMSCRVFQRRVEFAFFRWLASRPDSPRRLRYAETPRNSPLRQFLEDPAFRFEHGSVAFDPAAFLARHQDLDAIFEMEVP